MAGVEKAEVKRRAAATIWITNMPQYIIRKHKLKCVNEMQLSIE